MNQPTHRERAEAYLRRAAAWLDAIPGDDQDHATVAAALGTGHAVLAHLDALALPEPGVGDTILDAARKLADELGPNPDFHARAFAEAVADTAFVGRDHGGATSGPDDHAEDAVPGAPVARVATNGPSPVSPDAKIGTGDLRADLVEQAATLIVASDGSVGLHPIEAGCEQCVRGRLGARNLLEAGWRPPLPDGGHDLTGHEFQRGMMVGLERVAIMLSEANLIDLSLWIQRCEIRVHTPGYPAEWEKPPTCDAPTPRVFFPGDTVPAGVAVRFDDGSVLEGEPDPTHLDEGNAPAVELFLPTREEWQAAVDRACAERREREQTHAAALKADLGTDVAREHEVLPDEDQAAEESTSDSAGREAGRG